MNQINQSLEKLKELNRSRAFNILRERETISRSELARGTGLSRAAISLLADDLLRLEIVREVGIGNSTGGRPPILLQFNPNARYALGARLRDHHWGIVVTNLDAQVVERLDAPIADATPKSAVFALKEGIAQIQKRVDATRLLPAVGVGTPGLVEVESGVVKTAVDVGWFDVPIRQMLEEALGRRVYVANRSRVGALAEMWHGPQNGVSDLIYISIGTGVAAGIIIGGDLYPGTNSSAGELGHITILPDGPPCPCGNRGCLQQLVSGPAIVERARQQMQSAPPTLEALFAAAKQNNPDARAIVEETASYLGIAVANLVNLFNPQRIVLGGPVGQAGQVLLKPLRREVRSRAMAYPLSAVQIVQSGLGADAGAIGAAVLVLQQTRELFAS